MSTEQPAVKSGTLLAASDLSALQYTAVKLDNTGKITPCTVLGEKVFGILQNKPAAGEVCEITVIGVTKIKANAAITAGDKIMTAASGKLATAATAASTIIGFAYSAAAAANELPEAFVNCCTGVV